MPSHRRLIWAFVAIAAACSRPGPSDDVQGPAVVRSELVPAPEDANVWARDAMVIPFTEPVVVDSLDAAVALTGKNGVQLGKLVSIEDGGRRLRITFVAGPEPGRITCGLDPSRIRDRAGNPMAPLTEAWSWTLPEWQQPGGAALNDEAVDQGAAGEYPWPSIALDTAGNPLVAWSASATAGTGGPVRRVIVKRWDGARWVAVGGPVNADPGRDAIRPVLAVDSGDVPHVAFVQAVGTSQVRQALVARWTGGAWIQVGTALNRSPGKHASWVDLRLDAQDRPVVAWIEGLERVIGGAAADVDVVYVSRLEGGSWQPLGDALNLDPAHRAGTHSLALDPSGEPVVAFTQTDGVRDRLYVKRRASGGTWSLLGGSGESDASVSVGDVNAQTPRLALQPGTGIPFVAWYQDVGPGSSSTTPLHVFVKQLAGAGWSLVGASALNTSASFRAGSPYLAFSRGGVPVLAFDENGADPALFQILVRRLGPGGAWEPLGPGPLNAGAGRTAQIPAVAVDDDGTPFVVWSERRGDLSSPLFDIHVKRYNQ